MSFHVVDRVVDLQAGVPRAFIDNRVRDRRYQQLYRGIYLSGTADSEREAWLTRLRAHVVRGGPNAAVSHRAAAKLHGLDGFDGYPEDVLVPFSSGFRNPPAIRTRSLHPVEVEQVNGLPVTTLERTLPDLLRMLTHDEFETAFESALRPKDSRQPLNWNAELLVLLQESVFALPDRRPGVAAFRAFLGARGDVRPTGSFAETRALQALRGVGLGSLCRQPFVQVVDASGREVRRWFPDFGDLRRGVIFEIDGSVAHSTSAALDRDLQRQNELSNWFVVLRWAAARVLRDPIAVAGEAQRRLAHTPEHEGGWPANGAWVEPGKEGWTIRLPR